MLDLQWLKAGRFIEMQALHNLVSTNKRSEQRWHREYDGSIARCRTCNSTKITHRCDHCGLNTCIKHFHQCLCGGLELCDCCRGHLCKCKECHGLFCGACCNLSEFDP